MRVVFVLWEGTAGGAELHTAALAGALAARGHWAGVVTISKPEAVDGRLGQMGIAHASLSLERGRDLLRHGGDLRRILERAKPDVVVLPHNDGLPALLRACGCRLPLVAMEHGAALAWRSLPPLRRVRYRALRLVGRHLLLGEIAVSGFAADNLRTMAHAPVAVIHNGMDTSRFRPGPRSTGDPAGSATARTFGVVSRLVPGKGVDLAIRATARANLLWGSEGRFELRIAGDGPDLPRLIALVGSLRSDNCIHFLGTIDDVPGFWRSAAVAIHVPDTFIESFGLAPLEAVACGRRAIVSSTKASDEILGECSAAAAVPKGDFCGLAEQMAREARRGPATADEADRYHEWVVERFGIETTAQEYEEVLGRWLSTTR